MQLSLPPHKRGVKLTFLKETGPEGTLPDVNCNVNIAPTIEAARVEVLNSSSGTSQLCDSGLMA